MEIVCWLCSTVLEVENGRFSTLAGDRSADGHCPCCGTPLETPTGRITMPQPRFDLDTIPVCTPGMGVELAYQNGYKHGWQGVVTTGVCTLVKGTPEYVAWHEGYCDGDVESRQT